MAKRDAGTTGTAEKRGETPPDPPEPSPAPPLDPERAWLGPFLAALALTGNVTAACRAAPVARRTAYNRRGADDAFARAWAEALEESTDDLVAEARRRALEGVRKLKFHQGELIRVPLLDARGDEVLDERGQPLMVPYSEHEYSDVLLIFLLKAHRPSVYRETFRHEHSGDPRPVTFVEVLRDAPDRGSEPRP